MIKLPKDLTKAEAISYVYRNYSMNEIVETLVEFITNDYVEPIIITKEQFQKFFKIRGVKQINLDTMAYVAENRGRAIRKDIDLPFKKDIEDLPKIDMNDLQRL